MNLQLSRVAVAARVPLAAAAFFLAGSIPSAYATVLTFDAGLGIGANMPQAYGDSVTDFNPAGPFSYGSAGGFTPNVVVDYVGVSGGAVGTGLSFWSTGFGDLVNILNNEDDGENLMRVDLIADSGFSVLLDGFDLGSFGSTIIVPELRIEDGVGAELFSSTNFSATAVGHVNFDFAPLSAPHLKIMVDLTGLGSSSDNIGLDNIQFGQQVVPEPTTISLVGMGLAGLGAGRKWKKKATGHC